MKQPTPKWRDSSIESVRLSPRASQWLGLWWWFLHGLAALAILVSSLPAWWKCLILAGVLAHFRWRAARHVPDLERAPSGHWSVPSLDRHELTLAATSRFGGWWIRVVLEDSLGGMEWILFRDQLSTAHWCLLADEVRAANCRGSEKRVRMG